MPLKTHWRADALPRSGNCAPSIVTANCKLDRQELRDGALDQHMTFAKAPVAAKRPELAEVAE